MPLHKKSGADVRRSYFLFLEIGLVLSLVLLVGIAVIPFDGPGRLGFPTGNPEIIRLERIESIQRAGAPPPTVQPPPVAIPEDLDIEEEFLAEVELEENEPAPDSIIAPNRGFELPKGGVVPEIFEVVEDYPELIGGLERLQSLIVYPEVALEARVEGTVFLQFVVNEDGSVTDVDVMRTPDPTLSQAAINALRQSTWRPGLQRGRPVKVRFTIPVRFKINDQNDEPDDSASRIVESQN